MNLYDDSKIISPQRAYDIVENLIKKNIKPDPGELREALNTLRGLTHGQEMRYQINSSIICEDSDFKQFGVVRDVEGKIFPKHGEGIIIGDWSRSPVDCCIHMNLSEHVRAQWDRAVKMHEELSRRRHEGLSLAVTITKTGKSKKIHDSKSLPEPLPEPVGPSEDTIKMQKLGNMLTDLKNRFKTE